MGWVYAGLLQGCSHILHEAAVLKWNRGPEPWWPCAARYVNKAAIDALTIMGLAGLSIAMSSIAKLTEGSKLLSD